MAAAEVDRRRARHRPVPAPAPVQCLTIRPVPPARIARACPAAPEPPAVQAPPMLQVLRRAAAPRATPPPAVLRLAQEHPARLQAPAARAPVHPAAAARASNSAYESWMPSNASKEHLRSRPPAYPVGVRDAPITRWHGTTIDTGLRPIAAPTARSAFELPTRSACCI
jgi:hypothetical protein